MQIYAKLNDNKSIQAYSNEQQEGYKALTIDAADAHFLPEYHGLMWADDNGLVHAENLPVTTYQRQLAEQEEAIKQESDKVSQALGNMETKFNQANDVNAELDAKIKNVNTVMAQMAQTLATIQAASLPQSSENSTGSTTNEATSNANKGE